MKKSYFLGLAMLLGVTGEGYAQKIITDFSGLQAAKSALDASVRANEEINAAEAELQSLRLQYSAIPATKNENVRYGYDEKDAIKAFYDATRSGYTGEIKELYYKLEKDGTLYIRTAAYDGFSKVSSATDGDLSYKKLWANSVLEGLEDGAVYMVVAFYSKGETETSYGVDSESGISTTAALLRKLNTLQSQMPAGTEIQAVPNTEALAAKQKEIDEQQKIVDDYKAKISAAAEYKNIVLGSNVTIEASSPTFTLGTWGSDYVINGNGYKIVYPNETAGNLFAINQGTIMNLGIENGTFAVTNTGRITTSFETANKTSYNIYDESGIRTTNVLNMDLGYKLRSSFGLSINADGTLGVLDKKTADNIVYKAQYTDAKSKEQTVFYANVVNGNLSYNPTVGKKNTFVYVQDTDIEAEAFTNGKNIVVNGKCANAVLEDATSEENDDALFIPAGFTAVKLSYDRAFSASDMATTCLPFSLTATEYAALGIDKIMQFNDVDVNTNTYWFQYQNGSMAANEPYVLKFKDGKPSQADGKVFASLENKEISATGSKDIYAVAPSKQGAGAEFLGLYAATNASVLAPVSQYKLYGFSGGVFRPMATDANCKAFRTYVRTAVTDNSAQAKEFRIGLLDENGNVVEGGGTTGIDTVKGADSNAFSVKGGINTINITTGKAQKVNVYTVGGSLVKSATVEAGSTSIPVSGGIYIVNGKKVVVK